MHHKANSMTANAQFLWTVLPSNTKLFSLSFVNIKQYLLNAYGYFSHSNLASLCNNRDTKRKTFRTNICIYDQIDRKETLAFLTNDSALCAHET